MTDQRLASVDLDEATLPSATAEIEHERRVAIFDLVEKNVFTPEGADAGPYGLKLSLQDNRLVFDITGIDFARTYALSLTPLKSVLKDYLMICDSYYEALRGSSASQIEAVDMGRRGLHNEGAELLKARLDGKIEIDHETARRLFTLVCALYRRG
ncbi:UPF0262 family protein [Brevundimonas subvibrioides]|uniref:UPF0262 protein Bresu_2245 n=1 Tax=Brevundimonas subvibrioides (strain ATCC 15264 / DSM 4735 / LMG 14903 / NBRC 16000 / CB 81) TaxID=633149 RepID=D9QJJ4_BRESC|nr:UPF0262 family protein [Brevundimonas subvibrioides]ADL01555.1 conserved hypothetical protein [Brevundimonas subvibrioides ATCC 15264]